MLKYIFWSSLVAYQLKIRHCHCGSGSIPGPGISTCHGHSQKNILFFFFNVQGLYVIAIYLDSHSMFFMFLPLLLKLKLKILGFFPGPNWKYLDLALTAVWLLWGNSNWGLGPIPWATFPGNAGISCNAWAISKLKEVTYLLCNFSNS